MTMQAQKEAPADMQCKDKFLLQCVVASPGVTAKDVTPEMVMFLYGSLIWLWLLYTVFFGDECCSLVKRQGIELRRLS